MTQFATAPAPLSAADIAAIRAVGDDFPGLFMAGDCDALLEFYTPNATVMPPNAPAMHGREAIRGLFESFPPLTHFELNIDEIDGRADLAFVRGTFKMTMDVDGVSVDDVGKYIEIRRRQADGSWLLDVDIFNSDLEAEAHG